jgi:hypothetical protein
LIRIRESKISPPQDDPKTRIILGTFSPTSLGNKFNPNSVSLSLEYPFGLQILLLIRANDNPPIPKKKNIRELMADLCVGKYS